LNLGFVMFRAFLPAALALLPATSGPAATPEQDVSRIVPPSGVIGVQDAMLAPEYWVARAPDANTVLMPGDALLRRSRHTIETDPNLVDLRKMPSRITRGEVSKLMGTLVSPFSGTPVDAAGKTLSPSILEEIEANQDVQRIPDEQAPRYGLAVRRTLLRIHPSEVAAYPAADQTDFDSFAAGVLFPGDAAVILHRSRDARWLLVQTWQGPAWVHAADIATGSAEQVLGYAGQGPYRIVTGDKVRTVYTPEAPDISELQFDMGARLPLAKVPGDQPVNGASSYADWAVTLPVRAADGSLLLRPALIQKARDTSPDYLPLTRANIIRQAFKFLGERYGWGHSFNARDCSGFTSDVYRSFGIVLPPNSGAQGKSPGFQHQLFTDKSSHAERLDAVMHAKVGDLLVVPGHVMMFLGKVAGQPYMIQDVPFAIYRDGAGHIHRTKVNGVSVTPLLPLLYDDQHSYVDAMTSLVHVSAS
jgi:cell wall-associated NlpC family hydrolase